MRLSHADRAAIRKRRAEEFAVLYRSGMTLQAIGTQHGITRERVRQIMTLECGIRWTDRPHRIKALSVALEKAQAKHERMQKPFMLNPPMTLGEAWEFNGGISPYQYKTPVRAYFDQWRNANKRGIKFEITFPEWMQFWLDSGHWHERGRGKGYCMARWGDSGAYAIGNVYICTIGQNFKDSYIVKPAAERAAKRRTSASPQVACKWGHEYTPENTGIDVRGHRYCLECARTASRKSYARKRASQSTTALFPDA